MKTHKLKIWPREFKAVKDGLKSFEFRRDDRDYQVGDALLLREWTQVAGYTGRTLETKITYKLDRTDFGLPEGFCILSFVIESKARAE